MADERYVVVMVECPRCKTKRKVHVASSTGGAQMGRPDDSMHQVQQAFQSSGPR